MCKVKNKILFMRLVFIVSGPVYKGNFNFTQLMAKTKMSFFSPKCLYLPQWLSREESACNAGDTGSNPGSGRSPGEGNSNPLQYSCPGNPMDGRT